MSTTAWVIIIIVALILGFVGGFFVARKYMMNYFEENPPISEDMIRSMMTQMGQKPSEKRVKQIVASMSKRSTKK